MRSITADPWDEVWAEYDRRTQVVAGRLAPPAPAAVAIASATPRARGRRWWAAALLALGLGLSAGYAAAPVMAAQRVVAALGSADAATLAGAVDWRQLEAGLAGELLAETHALPPGRTAGLTPAGLDYLQGMAREVSAGLATSEGLAEAVRRRLGLAERPDARLAPPRVQPLGATSARLVLSPVAGEAGPVSLTLALTEPMQLRWQVVAVSFAD